MTDKMANVRNTQEDDGEELIELSLAVVALLHHTGKQSSEHFSETDVLSEKIREEILKEKLHVRRLKGENASLRTSLDFTKKCQQQKDDQISELRYMLQYAMMELDDKEDEMRNMYSSQNTKLHYLRLEIECRKENGNKLQEEINSIKIENRQMSDKIKHLEDEIQEKDSMLRKLNVKLKSSLKTQQEKETEWDQTMSSFRKSNNRLEKEIEIRERNIKSLEEMLAIMRTEKNGEHSLLVENVKESDNLLSDQTDQLQTTLNQLREQEVESRRIIISLENQNQVKDDRLRDLRKKLDNKDAEMVNYEASQKKNLKDIETEIDRREQQISKLEGKLKEKDVAIANICCRIEQLETQVNEKDELLSEHKHQHGQTLKQRYEAKSNLTLFKKKIQHLHAEIDDRDLKENNLEKLLHSKTIEYTEKVRTAEDVREKEEQIANLKDQLHHALTEPHDMGTELDETKRSKATVDGLTDNNPNLTDLSDRNRPTKLAERCAELYDNQWTDAFDILDKCFHSEDVVIGTLLTTFEDVMKFCKAKANEQMEELGCVLKFSSKHGKEDETNYGRNLLKDCRKAMAPDDVENLHKMYMSHLKKSTDETFRLAATEVSSFSKECLEICWFMVVQDPPVVFAPLVKKGSVFNPDLYRPYKCNGTHVDYVVWPAMLLHEGGPVLAKGVAQCYNKT